MKKGSTYFLRAVIFLIGTLVVALLAVLLPIGIATDQTGYYRPLLIGMYIPAVPFFVALYQSWKLLEYIDKNKAFSALSVKALGLIKYSGVAIGALYALGMPYIFYVGDRDDAPGIVALGLVFIFASWVVATFASVLEKLIHSAVELKSENDLTV